LVRKAKPVIHQIVASLAAKTFNGPDAVRRIVDLEPESNVPIRRTENHRSAGAGEDERLKRHSDLPLGDTGSMGFGGGAYGWLKATQLFVDEMLVILWNISYPAEHCTRSTMFADTIGIH
jgi:hypothetical protein